MRLFSSWREGQRNQSSWVQGTGMDARRYSIYHHTHDYFTKNETKVTPIYRICLTGGPCAGKTTAIAELQNHIENRGFRVFNVPEAATLLMKAGAMIDNKKLDDQTRENFQMQLMKTQISLEDIIFNIAQDSGEPSVILMDRGLMDSAGYSGWAVWHKIL